jgi:hypothetical protein
VADDESPQERVNRELIELLNEVRVALPGVQVLFAFLLAVPFQQRFTQTSAFERDTYFATLSLAFIATAMLIAPTALHRLNFRQHDKRRIVDVSNSLVIGGIAVLGVALIGTIIVVGDFLFGSPTAAIAPAIGAVVLLLLWVVLPWHIRRMTEDRSDGLTTPGSAGDGPADR